MTNETETLFKKLQDRLPEMTDQMLLQMRKDILEEAADFVEKLGKDASSSFVNKLSEELLARNFQGLSETVWLAAAFDPNRKTAVKDKMPDVHTLPAPVFGNRAQRRAAKSKSKNMTGPHYRGKHSSSRKLLNRERKRRQTNDDSNA